MEVSLMDCPLCMEVPLMEVPLLEVPLMEVPLMEVPLQDPNPIEGKVYIPTNT